MWAEGQPEVLLKSLECWLTRNWKLKCRLTRELQDIFLSLDLSRSLSFSKNGSECRSTRLSWAPKYFSFVRIVSIFIFFQERLRMRIDKRGSFINLNFFPKTDAHAQKLQIQMSPFTMNILYQSTALDVKVKPNAFGIVSFFQEKIWMQIQHQNLWFTTTTFQDQWLQTIRIIVNTLVSVSLFCPRTIYAFLKQQQDYHCLMFICLILIETIDYHWPVRLSLPHIIVDSLIHDRISV